MQCDEVTLSVWLLVRTSNELTESNDTDSSVGSKVHQHTHTHTAAAVLSTGRRLVMLTVCLPGSVLSQTFSPISVT